MDFSAIRGVIWDLDNTLYRFDAMFEEACNRAAAKTICDMVEGLTYEEAFAAAEESYNTHGYSGKALIARYNLAYSDYHFPYHETIDETILQKNDDMLRALAALDRPQVIVTNASRHWAEKVLAHLGMKQFFPDTHIISLEDSEFEAKAHSPRPFVMAQDILGCLPQNIVVVEDTVKNLSVPKSMGFYTALIHHGRAPGERHDFIDAEFSDTLELLKSLGAF